MSPAHIAMRDILACYTDIARHAGVGLHLGRDNDPDPDLDAQKVRIVLMDENSANGPAEFGNDWLFRFAERTDAVWSVWENVPDLPWAFAVAFGALIRDRALIVIITDERCGPAWERLVSPSFIARSGEGGPRVSFVTREGETRQ